LRLLFDAYDLDSNGQLDRDELYQIYKASLSFSGQHNYATHAEQHAAITRMVDEVILLLCG
jgi:Ca2+-binding EF-hand superfamily protein